ncbi:MAG: radical SAM protein [Candidatus Firestonebacteria bacterium]|nr:radical SAM protein [Candidatus Firestonebacteria bacterium]
MKILCLNAPFKTEYGRFSRTSRSPSITKSGTLYYPIWLCYAAGVIEEAGFDIKIIDSCAYSFDLNKTLELIKEYKPNIAILDTSTPSIYEDVKTGVAIKKIFPDCFVALMGTHPTALPEETLKFDKNIDAIIIGEADYIAKELVEKISKTDLHKLQIDNEYRDNILNSIDGIAYRTGEKIIVNKRREFVQDLDKLPFISKVYKKHLDIKKYFFAASDYPEIQIMTARGCVARCTFCVYPQTIHGFKYRMRSPKNIADEFEWIVQNLPEVREIGIEDDTFAGSHKRVVEFCQEILKRKIKIKWYCNVRVDLNYDTMVWMKKAGCALVTVGYESANKKILENINKRTTPEMIIEFSQNTRKAGLLVHGCFMAGNRGETRETLKESFDLALKIMDDTMQFFPLMVYPGTEDYKWAKENGFLTVKDYSDYLTPEGLHNSCIRLNDITDKELVSWCNDARKAYYLRPKYIAYKGLQVLKNPSEFRRTFKTFKRFIKFLF